MHKLLTQAMLSLGVVLTLGGTVSAAGTPTPKPATTPAPKVAVEQPKAPEPPKPKVHVVAEGDSLSSIAEAEALPSWKPLWDVNTEISNPDIVYAGQQLTVPTEPTVDRPLPAVAVAQPVAVNNYNSYQAPRAQVRAAAPANYAAGAGGILARIRQRESGGNYSINTGNGYYGAYQYDNQTWNNYGGYARADLAPPAVQDAKAADTYARRGCSPWPNTCY